MFLKLVRSPLNYTGNKYRILPQILPYFPKEIDTFVDLFSGGATVGLNVDAKRVVFIDSNERVINLLQFLYDTPFSTLINKIENIIYDYRLSYSYKYGYSTYREKGYVKGNNGLKAYNEDGYYRLRKEYNEIKNKNSQKANAMLYVLLVYAFNNDIRFNRQGEFNMPVGKTDFNKSNYTKLKEFKQRSEKKDYLFLCLDFTSEQTKQIIEDADFIYADPPYILTNAVYNGKNNWSIEEEKALLEMLTQLDKNQKQFALSNIIETSEENHDILKQYVKNNKWKVIDIDYHYRSASYNKINRNKKEREVLVVNESIKNK